MKRIILGMLTGAFAYAWATGDIATSEILEWIHIGYVYATIVADYAVIAFNAAVDFAAKVFELIL